MQKLNDVVTDAVGKAIICEVLETYAWKPVSGYKEIPVGEWLVKLLAGGECIVTKTSIPEGDALLVKNQFTNITTVVTSSGGTEVTHYRRI